jgi:hypothetical protein
VVVEEVPLILRPVVLVVLAVNLLAVVAVVRLH